MTTIIHTHVGIGELVRVRKTGEVAEIIAIEGEALTIVPVGEVEARIVRLMGVEPITMTETGAVMEKEI
jgi:hypothetical protein